MKPRVLYLCREFPYYPAHSGNIEYTRNVVESLAPVSELKVVCMTNGEVAQGAFSRGGIDWVVAGAYRRRSPLSLLSSLPLVAWRGRGAAYMAAVRAALSQGPWDAVVIDNLNTFLVLPDVLALKKADPKVRIAYLSHEHEASVRIEKYAAYGGNVLLRTAMRLDGLKIVRAERELVQSVDLVSVINPDDVAKYRKDFPNPSYHVLLPGYEGEVVATRTIDASCPRRVGVVGGRGPKHKQMILVEWLRASVALFDRNGIETCVTGSMEPAFVAELKAEFPTVRFLGYVEDMKAFLGSTRVAVVPDAVGGGFKLRLVTLVFHRMPMFGLEGAISGLPVASGAGYLEYPTLPKLAEGIADNIDDLEELNRLQNTAFAACDGRFSWAERGESFVRALVADQVR